MGTFIKKLAFLLYSLRVLPNMVRRRTKRVTPSVLAIFPKAVYSSLVNHLTICLLIGLSTCSGRTRIGSLGR